jgi:hypothetical protein
MQRFASAVVPALVVLLCSASANAQTATTSPSTGALLQLTVSEGALVNLPRRTVTELDPRITDKIVLLADKRNGLPMGADLGPFRVVVPDEKHQVRWVRNVTEIAVLTAM